jgi:hypothetical protein
MRQYGGDRTTFMQVGKEYCTGFIECVKAAKNTALFQRSIGAGVMIVILVRRF